MSILDTLTRNVTGSLANNAAGVVGMDISSGQVNNYTNGLINNSIGDVIGGLLGVDGACGGNAIGHGRGFHDPCGGWDGELKRAAMGLALGAIGPTIAAVGSAIGSTIGSGIGAINNALGSGVGFVASGVSGATGVNSNTISSALGAGVKMATAGGNITAVGASVLNDVSKTTASGIGSVNSSSWLNSAKSALSF